MNFIYTPYLLPLIAASAVALLILAYTWPRRLVTGAPGLMGIAGSLVIWMMGYSLEIAGTTLDAKYLGGVIGYFGYAFAPYGWLVFALSFGEHTRFLSRRWLMGLAVIPTLTVIFAFTTRFFGLLWTEYHIK